MHRVACLDIVPLMISHLRGLMVSFFPFGGALLWLFNMMGQTGQLTACTSFT